MREDEVFLIVPCLLACSRSMVWKAARSDAAEGVRAFGLRHTAMRDDHGGLGGGRDTTDMALTSQDGHSRV